MNLVIFVDKSISIHEPLVRFEIPALSPEEERQTAIAKLTPRERELLGIK